MKRIITLVAVVAVSFVPFASSNAQSASSSDVWGALGKVASLENAQTLETIYGNVVVDDFTVDYNIEINSKVKNGTESISSASNVKAQITILNEGDMDFAAAFRQMDIRLEGEWLMHDDDLYLKLSDLALNAEGGDENVQDEIGQIMMIANPIKGNWYHLAWDDLEGMEGSWSGFSEKEFLQNFKNDPKMAVKSLIQTAVTEHVKQEQYYNSMFGSYDVPTVDVLDSTLEEDYAVYMNEEVKKNPVDLKGLVEKKVLECEGEAHQADDLANGFQYPGCWPSISYTGPLSEAEEKLIDQLYAGSGRWVYENDKWYYVQLHTLEEGALTDKEQLTYDDIVSPEAFEYDQAALDNEVNKIMRGVDLLLNADLFHEREVVLGPNKGYQFYNLNRAAVWHAMQAFGQTIGEEMDTYDADQLWDTLLKMNLAGVYNIREDNGLLDDLFARFRFRDDTLFDYFEINYKFKLTDWTTENTIQLPSKVTRLESFEDLME